MSQVSNSIDSLRQWFRQCPLLSKSNRFGADYLGENPTEYAIYASPSTLKYRENILGESVLEDKQTQNYILPRAKIMVLMSNRILTISPFHGAYCLDDRTEQCPKLPPHGGGSGYCHRTDADRLSGTGRFGQRKISDSDTNYI